MKFCIYCSAVKTGEGTAIEACTNVGVRNMTEFILELSLDDCSQFGSEPRYAWEGEVIGQKGVRERGGGGAKRRGKKGRSERQSLEVHLCISLSREMLVNAFPLGNVIIQIDGTCDCGSEVDMNDSDSEPFEDVCRQVRILWQWSLSN